MKNAHSLRIGPIALAAGRGGEDMPESAMTPGASPDSPGEALCVDMGPPTPRGIASS